MTQTIETDVLVIGGGSAATRAAIEAARLGVKVTLVDKGVVSESGSSPNALVGFSAQLVEEDSDELFLQDWLNASGGICDQNLVMEAVRQGGETAKFCDDIGVDFLRNPDGSWFISQRAGHSAKRTLMAKGVGKKHANVILAFRAAAIEQGVEFHEGVMVTRLLKQDDEIVGAFGIDASGEEFVFSAKSVVLATGGVNRLYPCICAGLEAPVSRTTGDGYSLGFHAGAPIIDMEFTQFRDSPPAGPIFGAHYMNNIGERIMEKYDPVALERAPRHMMAKAVYWENFEGRGPVVWYVEDDQVAKSRAPVGLEYTGGQVVEITLQFQRLMGGAKINEKAETAIPRLFAAGESSGGIQGGDRMQGCGFLETQVFGGIAGKNAAALAQTEARVAIDPAIIAEEQSRLAKVAKGGSEDPAKFVETVQTIMWEQAGVVSDKETLEDAISKLVSLRKDVVPQLDGDNMFAALEAANQVLTSEMVARAKLAREETRSCSNRRDFPEADENWIKHVSITKDGDDIAMSTIPVVTL